MHRDAHLAAIAAEILAPYGIPLAPEFLSTTMGRCLLALASNAQAEAAAQAGVEKPTAYRYKFDLVASAIAGFDPRHWWADLHRHGEYGHTVIFVEVDTVQFSFHTSHPTLENLEAALRHPVPRAEGRRWSRRPLKPYAAALLHAFHQEGNMGVARVVAGIAPIPEPAEARHFLVVQVTEVQQGLIAFTVTPAELRSYLPTNLDETAFTSWLSAARPGDAWDQGLNVLAVCLSPAGAAAITP